MSQVKQIAKDARTASFRMATLTTQMKNNALQEIAKQILANKDEIIDANKKDIVFAEQTKLALPLQKRLLFNDEKINAVVDGIYSLIHLTDPVGQKLLATELDVGLNLYKVSCPFGVIGIIFESRPDALVQIASLCLKAGNAVLLKGGTEASHTNHALEKIISQAGIVSGLPENWIQLLDTREQVKEMLDLNAYIDLLIPRGSNEFVIHIMKNTNIPVLGHADGVCHLYIHEHADADMAIRLAVDSKTETVSVCNAVETILIDKKIARKILPELANRLREKNVVLYGCEKTGEILGTVKTVDNWHCEYLDYAVSICIVDDFTSAVNHINTYGSGHTDCIVTQDEELAKTFMGVVDSGNVFWNCSTRFSDGFRYGFGAEVGVSTTKLHARGPVGLEGLVTYKYLVHGNGQTVQDYVSGKSSFTHKPISIKKEE